MFKNILILGHSNIGDVCYDLVVVRHLRSNYPQAKINFLTSSRGKELAQNYPGIDEVIVFDKYSQGRGIFKRFSLIKTLRLKKYDLAIVLPQTLFFIFLSIPNIWKLAKKMRQDYRGAPIHVVDSYLNLLRSHNVPIKDGQGFNFVFSREELDFADSFFAKNSVSSADTAVSISPFTNWSLKCWPVDKWNKLIDKLNSDYKLKVIVLGKIGLDRYSQELYKRLSPSVISAINKCSLKQSMAIIKKSKLFISCDSSLLHISSCMQIPSIGLYGPTAISNYFPYFHSQAVIVAKAAPFCAPCLNTKRFAQCKTEGDSLCMQEITVEQVLERVGKDLGVG